MAIPAEWLLISRCQRPKSCLSVRSKWNWAVISTNLCVILVTCVAVQELGSFCLFILIFVLKLQDLPFPLAHLQQHRNSAEDSNHHFLCFYFFFQCHCYQLIWASVALSRCCGTHGWPAPAVAVSLSWCTATHPPFPLSPIVPRACLRCVCVSVSLGQWCIFLFGLVAPAAFTSLIINSLGPAPEEHCFVLVSLVETVFSTTLLLRSTTVFLYCGIKHQREVISSLLFFFYPFLFLFFSLDFPRGGAVHHFIFFLVYRFLGGKLHTPSSAACHAYIPCFTYQRPYQAVGALSKAVRVVGLTRKQHQQCGSSFLRSEGQQKAFSQVPPNGFKPQGGSRGWPAASAGSGEPQFLSSCTYLSCNKRNWWFSFFHSKCWYWSYAGRRISTEDTYKLHRFIMLPLTTGFKKCWSQFSKLW